IDEEEEIIPLPRSEFDSVSVSDAADSEPGAESEAVDTALLVRKVKDRLHLHGISQRLFGEAVLGISAGGCSELFLRPRRWSTLSLFGEAVLGISAGGCSELFLRPRRWSTLSVRGREPYEKMRTWLADKEAVQRLLVKERMDIGLPLEKNLVNGNGKRLSDPPYEPPPRKVQRTIITEQQKEALRFVFQHEHHPSQKTVELLSLKLNLNIRTVNNWFHNHRTRQKASLREGKVYPPAVGNLPTSKNWQQDLHSILENASRFSLMEDSPPTMVPVPATPLFTSSDSPPTMVPVPATPLFTSSGDELANSSLLFSNDDPPTTATSTTTSTSPLFSSEERCEKASQLDRAVAKMRMLAASKSARDPSHDPAWVVDTLARNEFELNQLRGENTAQKELIEKLEADLAAAVAGQNKTIDDDLSTMEMLGSVHETKLEGDTNSVFTIVLAQRDRLKLRVGVLEEELMAEKTKHGVLQTEIDKLREDNVKLYGKIKFLQGYGRKSTETSVPLPEESNYSAQYEKRLDPFQRFGQAETQRTYARLPLHDRASLSIGKAIMTSPSARMTFFFYLLFLHLLVSL
ncbi:unnamed protein product, partial [Strongylus vulgaris]